MGNLLLGNNENEWEPEVQGNDLLMKLEKRSIRNAGR
jgi:hypothetical protein